MNNAPTETHSEHSGIILFWPQFVEAILTGQKTQTRRWGLNRKFEIGQILEARNSETDKAFGLLEVLKIYYQTLDDMSEEEARLDGLAIKADFMDCIQKIYPDAKEKDDFTVVEFRLVQETL